MALLGPTLPALCWVPRSDQGRSGPVAPAGCRALPTKGKCTAESILQTIPATLPESVSVDGPALRVLHAASAEGLTSVSMQRTVMEMHLDIHHTTGP
ncbi:hypothetical protein GCM10025778_21050 [Paeniglutamicibacter antarcticus]|uniref:Uncharacterized protein n=1 Tax=Paeniglutamicibacter antarcticus TaxID=494023 RepID=A0ABP9TPC1_9MICC